MRLRFAAIRISRSAAWVFASSGDRLELRLQLPVDAVERLRGYAELLVERDREVAFELPSAPQGRVQLAFDS
jgi:hypothetical protein